MYVIYTATNIGYRCWLLLLMVNVHIAHAQTIFYHFRKTVTHATFGLLVVAVFLVSSNIPTADLIRGERVIVGRIIICILGSILSITMLELSTEASPNQLIEAYVLHKTCK